MREKQVDGLAGYSYGQAERADAGARVEHDQAAVPCPDLDAGGIPAVPDRLRAGSSE